MDANEVAAHERFYGRVLGAVNKLIGDLWQQDGLTPADFGRIAARALKEAAARAEQGNSEWEKQSPSRKP